MVVSTGPAEVDGTGLAPACCVFPLAGFAGAARVFAPLPKNAAMVGVLSAVLPAGSAVRAGTLFSELKNSEIVGVKDPGGSVAPRVACLPEKRTDSVGVLESPEPDVARGEGVIFSLKNELDVGVIKVALA